MKKIGIILFSCIGLVLWNGCQSFHGTKFAPLAAKLESPGGDAAQSLVLVNSSGQILHNVQFTAYMWGHGQANTGQPSLLVAANGQPEPSPVLTYRFVGAAAKLDPGQVIRFAGNGSIGESQALESPTKIQLAGKCDEGAFRETWVMGDYGQLELTGVPKD